MRGEDAAVGSQLVSGGSSGFNALLSGSAMEVIGGNYGASAAGTAGYFWTSTSVSSNAIYRSIFDGEPEVQRKNEKKTATEFNKNERKYGILSYRHNLQGWCPNLCSMTKAKIRTKEININIKNSNFLFICFLIFI